MTSPFTLEPVQRTEDFARIEALPRRSYTDAEVQWIVETMTRLLRTPAGTQTLFPIQAIALWELMHYGGLLGAMPVGSGKELVCFLAATVLRVTNAVLLMPASLVERSEIERRAYGENWRVSFTTRILSFSKLGLAHYAQELEHDPPRLLISNEAHYLKNPRCAVGKRYRRFVRAHPAAAVVNVSGTLLTKSAMDFGPLVRHCLKAGAPVPYTDHELKQWAEALDEKPGQWSLRPPGALLSLCSREELVDSEGPVVAARKGFCRRLSETPGVVAIGGADVATESGDAVRITIRAVDYYQDPIVETHYKTLRTKFETPNGWQFSSAMEVWAHARELASGLHYEWADRPEGWISAASPGPWIEARRAWAKYVRESLKYSQTMDSELQVWTACEAMPRPPEAFTAWRAIRETFEPVSRAVWHCTGTLDVAAAWARNNRGVIWTDHSRFAHELARRTGLRYFGRKGLDKDGLPIDPPPGPEQDALAASCVIASRHANSTGRNMQFWDRGLVISSPANGREWEQLIGRFHRPGQRSDEVRFDVLVGCREHWAGWTRSVELARMTRDMLGAPQKILIASSTFPCAEEIAWRGGTDDAKVYKWRDVSESCA